MHYSNSFNSNFRRMHRWSACFSWRSIWTSCLFVKLWWNPTGTNEEAGVLSSNKTGLWVPVRNEEKNCTLRHKLLLINVLGAYEQTEWHLAIFSVNKTVYTLQTAVILFIIFIIFPHFSLPLPLSLSLSFFPSLISLFCLSLLPPSLCRVLDELESLVLEERPQRPVNPPAGVLHAWGPDASPAGSVPGGPPGRSQGRVFLYT